MAAAPALRLPWVAIATGLLSYLVLLWLKGWPSALATIGLALLLWALARLLRKQTRYCILLAYLTFFITPLLTWNGQIGILTGFGGSSLALPWLGISFVTASMAGLLLRQQLHWRTLWLNLLQPLRFNSGPCVWPQNSPQHSPQHSPLPSARPERIPGRLRRRYFAGWIILGAFFYAVLGAGLAPLLMLKQSTDALDIVLFAILFEAYVYFNFSGISFMVYGLLNLAGIPTVRNFNTPFAARNLIGYWQRWHISLSGILRLLFFEPLKARLPAKLALPMAVMTVFLASAAWHGVSLNFLLWGTFHGLAWLLSHALLKRCQGRWHKLGQGLNGLLLPFTVLLGRLIFSEADTALLWLKCQHLLTLQSSADAWCWHLSLDRNSTAILLLALGYLLAEVCCTRRLRRYKLLRQRWSSVLLLLLCLSLGTSGLGGVYGAR